MSVTDPFDTQEKQAHEHSFLTHPGRCMFCGIWDDSARQMDQSRMLTEAFDRLAAVLEKLEKRL